jgi:hypothetical protein
MITASRILLWLLAAFSIRVFAAGEQPSERSTSFRVLMNCEGGRLGLIAKDGVTIWNIGYWNGEAIEPGIHRFVLHWEKAVDSHWQSAIGELKVGIQRGCYLLRARREANAVEFFAVEEASGKEVAKSPRIPIEDHPEEKGEANQPPLRMPVSVTPAADAPVAPPPGIAGR